MAFNTIRVKCRLVWSEPILEFCVNLYDSTQSQDKLASFVSIHREMRQEFKSIVCQLICPRLAPFYDSNLTAHRNFKGEYEYIIFLW